LKIGPSRFIDIGVQYLYCPPFHAFFGESFARKTVFHAKVSLRGAKLEREPKASEAKCEM